MNYSTERELWYCENDPALPPSPGPNITASNVASTYGIQCSPPFTIGESAQYRLVFLPFTCVAIV